MITASSRLAVFATWSLHQEFITEQHCVNKAKPEMLCSGRCYLNDQLVDVDDSLNTSAESTHKVTLQPWSFEAKVDLSSQDLVLANNSKQTWFYRSDDGRIYQSVIPDPPRV